MFDNLDKNLKAVEERIQNACIKYNRRRSDITLCAVSKTKPIEQIDFVADKGISTFGENYVNEIINKFPLSHSRYKLRMIGHLQTNKVAKVIPLVDSIDSVDSLHLLKKIEKCAVDFNKTIEVLFELNTSDDANKSGFRNIDDVRDSLNYIYECKNIHFNGFMTMGPVSRIDGEIRKSFDRFNDIVLALKKDYSDLSFSIMSFGMTDDFEIAIEKGSNMLRIGRAIFGER